MRRRIVAMTLKYFPNMTNFDKVMLITGGSKGIGEGVARVFVAAGARVVISSRGDKEGKSLAKELTTLGPGTCDYIHCDVSHPEEIKELIEKTVELHGRLDCLINNAGWHPDHKTIDDFSIEDFENLLRLNLVSYFAACKYALPHLRKTHGNIINMGSLVGEIGQEWATTYVTTKGGITALTKALAVDEARNGVRVNVVLPGVIITPLGESFINSNEDPQKVRDFIESWQWNGRRGTIEEVGYTCLFLASDGASFITGIELIISGGAELAYGIKYPKSGPIHI
jgi:NAD(P)-dependent dehydrogenase (short-subunit alcohol dehydrogenase family)